MRKAKLSTYTSFIIDHTGFGCVTNFQEICVHNLLVLDLTCCLISQSYHKFWLNVLTVFHQIFRKIVQPRVLKLLIFIDVTSGWGCCPTKAGYLKVE